MVFIEFDKDCTVFTENFNIILPYVITIFLPRSHVLMQFTLLYAIKNMLSTTVYQLEISNKGDNWARAVRFFFRTHTYINYPQSGF